MATTAVPGDGFSAWLRRPQQPTELERAQAELEHSERRLEVIRKTVIDPIYAKGRRNQFAEAIRKTLEGGA